MTVNAATARWFARALLQTACGLTGHQYKRWGKVPALSLCAVCRASTTEVTYRRGRRV